MDDGGQEDGPLTCASLRGLVVDCCGFDPGAIEASHRLDDIDLSGIVRLPLIARLEDAYGIRFPADLLTAIETVDDLLYYANTKVAQANRMR